MCQDVLETDLVPTIHDDRYCCTWTRHFDTHQSGCDLESRSQECDKAKTTTLVISKRFSFDVDYFVCTVETCWSESLILILSCLINIQGRESCLFEFVTPPPPQKKKTPPKTDNNNKQQQLNKQKTTNLFSVDLPLYISWLISLKLVIIIDTIRPDILIPLDGLDIFI